MNELLKLALKASEQGKSYAFATIIESTKRGTPQKVGAKMIVLESGELVGTIGGGRNEKAAKEQCLKAIALGEPCIVTYDFFGHEGQSVCGGRIKVLIEPFIGQQKIIICGGGHIGLPLSVLAKMLNFHVTVIDSRDEFIKKSRFPHVDYLIKGIHGQELGKLEIDKNTYVIVVTHGNEIDYECLLSVLKKDFKYLGVIASHAKRVKFHKKLIQEQISEDVFVKVRMPMGIDIGAQTPEEIAISIMAEIISVNRNQKIGSLKFKTTNTRKK